MALLNALTFKRGVKDTDDVISQEKPLAIGNKIWMHKPNQNKGLGWMLRHGGRVPTDQHIFGHLEDTPFPNWVTFVGAAEDSQGADTLVLASGHGARVTIGSRIFWPRTEEIIRLTAVMTTDTTGAVDRNHGRGVEATSLLKPGDKGVLLPPNFAQGFSTGLGMTNAMVYKSFATSEVSWPLQIANIEKGERSRGGDPFLRALSKVVDQSKTQMEAEMYLGGKVVDSTGSTPLSASEGLLNLISTHTYSASYLSRMDLWDIIGEWKMENKNGGAIHCSGAFKAMITMWSMGMMVMDQDAKADGMEIDQVKTPYGIFDLVEIDLFDQEPNLQGTALFIPKGQVDFRPFIGYENLDIRYRPISRDEVHAKEGELYGVYGWEIFEEEMFAAIDGMQFAA